MAASRVRAPAGVVSIGIAQALATLVPAVCAAQDQGAAPPGWDCLRCVLDEGWSLDLRAGPGAAIDAAFEFGDSTGVHAAGAYLFGDLLGSYRDADGDYASLEAWSRGTSAFGVFTEGGRQGAWQARASLQSLPRYLFDTTMTPFLRSTQAGLVLPTDWIHGPATQQMSALQNSLLRQSIAWDRRTHQFGVDYEPGSDWRLSIDYRQQRRDGNMRSSGSLLFSALEFVSPADYSTDDVEVTLEYSGEAWLLGASYFNSVFSNSHDFVLWDNPYTAIQGASQGQQALPPDNDAQRVTVSGFVSLPGRTSIAGSLSAGRLQQNALLLPFTTNTSLSAGALPSRHANAGADTSNFSLRATSSPWSRISLSGEFEFREFDNRTPTLIYDYIVTDVLAAANPATSTAYDFDKRELELRAEYRQRSGTKLEAGFATDRFERSAQARHRTQTQRYWLAARTRAGGANELSVELFDERRGGSSYAPLLDPSAPENPLMRKYNVADRDRRGAEFRGSFLAGERSDFGLEVEISADRYAQSLIGVTDTDYLRLGADYSVLYSDRTTLYVNAWRERFESKQANSQSFGAPDWTAAIDDEFDTVTIGGTITELFGVVDLEIETGWSQSIGEVQTDVSGAVSALPDTRSKRRYARVGIGYPYSARLQLHFDYYYERLSTRDWALDGVGPATVPALLALGAQPWRYRVNVLYASIAWSLAP